MPKKILGWPVTWALFWTGHIVSYSLRIDWYHVYVMYPIYNNLMLWSADVQDWAGLETPWTRED